MTKSFWESVNIENAGDRILTGFNGHLKDIKPYETLIDLCGNGNTVLDFGCGVGRHSVALSKNFKRVYGFDLKQMISLVPIENRVSNIKYSSDWANVKNKKFDVILASIVFQHIDDTELRSYLKDMVNMSDTIVLHSRTWMDDTNSLVSDIVKEYYSFETFEQMGDHFIAVCKVL
jgi:2-polyprenyl-3-methyl-5-hydroxy-6-metoxy-1,4-benzoquinol methylase